MKKPILEISTDDGPIVIAAEEIPAIPAEYLKRWRITRAELRRCFDIGQRLMEGYKATDRVRPCADETLDGTWEVRVVRYSQYTDPSIG